LAAIARAPFGCNDVEMMLLLLLQAEEDVEMMLLLLQAQEAQSLVSSRVAPAWHGRGLAGCFCEGQPTLSMRQ
jgi:hypothetical protein